MLSDGITLSVLSLRNWSTRPARLLRNVPRQGTPYVSVTTPRRRRGEMTRKALVSRTIEESLVWVGKPLRVKPDSRGGTGPPGVSTR